ncbi:protein UXT [Manacus vitellinus]|uniref:protein UXT n=1 Tax=Manacus vitellinus TaxID=328815 RepID=UPI00115E958B|nr:protein UXT [Manacus vitellinus]
MLGRVGGPWAGWGSLCCIGGFGGPQEAAAPLRTQVDLGCNFFVTAEVPDPQRVFVALGYGFYAELTLPEALRHLERRSRLLQR